MKTNNTTLDLSKRIQNKWDLDNLQIVVQTSHFNDDSEFLSIAAKHMDEETKWQIWRLNAAQIIENLISDIDFDVTKKIILGVANEVGLTIADEEDFQSRIAVAQVVLENRGLAVYNLLDKITDREQLTDLYQIMYTEYFNGDDKPFSEMVMKYISKFDRQLLLFLDSGNMAESIINELDFEDSKYAICSVANEIGLDFAGEDDFLRRVDEAYKELEG